jgi:hypothetical protein
VVPRAARPDASQRLEFYEISVLFKRCPRVLLGKQAAAKATAPRGRARYRQSSFALGRTARHGGARCRYWPRGSSAQRPALRYGNICTHEDVAGTLLRVLALGCGFASLSRCAPRHGPAFPAPEPKGWGRVPSILEPIPIWRLVESCRSPGTRKLKLRPRRHALGLFFFWLAASLICLLAAWASRRLAPLSASTMPWRRKPVSWLRYADGFSRLTAQRPQRRICRLTRRGLLQ